MIFKKGGRLSNIISVKYGDQELKIINRIVYLGIVFTAGGSFADTLSTLAGQAFKSFLS